MKTIITFLLILNAIHLCVCWSVVSLLDAAAPLIHLLHGENEEVCYQPLGCFRTDGDFGKSKHRPISVLPQSPQQIGTKFLLYTRKNSDEPQIIEPNDIQAFKGSHFNPLSGTKIIVHGFKEGQYVTSWQRELKNALLYQNDCNVIIVRWNRGSSGLYYQVVANTRVVGIQVAMLINGLIEETGTHSEQFHIIGHSLGAHIAGYAGSRVYRLGRITALDAAKPYFDGTSSDVRLDPSDALYIDAIHTDAPNPQNPIGIGTSAELGQIDFFPNNGNNQPGCNQEIAEALTRGGLIDGIIEWIGCDHQRSIDILIDSLYENDFCTPVAYRCPTWNDFESGRCANCGPDGNECAIIGSDRVQYHSNNNGTKFFLMTNTKRPYCVFQYLVQLKTTSDVNHINGRIIIRLYAEKYINELHRRFTAFSTNDVISFVFASKMDLGAINTIDIIYFPKKEINLIEDKIRDQVGVNRQLNVILVNIIPLNHISDREKMLRTNHFCIGSEPFTDSRRSVFRTENCIF